MTLEERVNQTIADAKAAMQRVEAGNDEADDFFQKSRLGATGQPPLSAKDQEEVDSMVRADMEAAELAVEQAQADARFANPDATPSVAKGIRRPRPIV